MLVFDSAHLNRLQEDGLACVVCDKRFPLPALTVGVSSASSPVRACEECALLLEPPADLTTRRPDPSSDR